MELHQLRYFCAWPDRLISRAAEQSMFPSRRFLSRSSSWKMNSACASSTASAARAAHRAWQDVPPRAHAVLRELEAAKGGGRGRQGVHRRSGNRRRIPTVPRISFLAAYCFSRKFPQVRLTVVEEINASTSQPSSSRHHSTLPFWRSPCVATSFEAVPLLTERLFAALPKKHKLNSRPSLSPQGSPCRTFPALRDGHCSAIPHCRLRPRAPSSADRF